MSFFDQLKFYATNVIPNWFRNLFKRCCSDDTTHSENSTIDEFARKWVNAAYTQSKLEDQIFISKITGDKIRPSLSTHIDNTIESVISACQDDIDSTNEYKAYAEYLKEYKVKYIRHDLHEKERDSFRHRSLKIDPRSRNSLENQVSCDKRRHIHTEEQLRKVEGRNLQPTSSINEVISPPQNHGCTGWKPHPVLPVLINTCCPQARAFSLAEKIKNEKSDELSYRRSFCNLNDSTSITSDSSSTSNSKTTQSQISVHSGGGSDTALLSDVKKCTPGTQIVPDTVLPVLFNPCCPQARAFSLAEKIKNAKSDEFSYRRSFCNLNDSASITSDSSSTSNSKTKQSEISVHSGGGSDTALLSDVKKCTPGTQIVPETSQQQVKSNEIITVTCPSFFQELTNVSRSNYFTICDNTIDDKSSIVMDSSEYADYNNDGSTVDNNRKDSDEESSESIHIPNSGVTATEVTVSDNSNEISSDESTNNLKIDQQHSDNQLIELESGSSGSDIEIIDMPESEISNGISIHH